MSEPLTNAPFLATTTYEVWFRLPGQDWRLWSQPYVEQHHAEDEQRRVERAGTVNAITPRETRIARRTTTVEWLDAY